MCVCLFSGIPNPVPSHLPVVRGSGHFIVFSDPIVTEKGPISADKGENLRVADEGVSPQTQALFGRRKDLSSLVQDFSFRPL